MENFMVNIVLPGAIFLAIIAAVMFIASLLVGIFQNVKGSIKLLVALGVIIVLFMIGYATASDVNPTSIELSGSSVRMITAGIVTMISLTILGVVTTIAMSIYNAVK
jgi:hypothetical protein